MTQAADRTQAPLRTRTFAWSDPGPNAAAIGRLTGAQTLAAMAAGELPRPPVMDLLGFERIAIEGEQIVVELMPQEFHYNPLGTVHGGILATLLDTAAACAVHATLAAGYGYTSMDLTTKYLRPVTVRSGLLRCVGSVVSRGRRTALAEARLTDAAGRLAAHATSSCLIFPLSEAAEAAKAAGQAG
jgi:uncharacterized protein (TIGR00369 family)